MLTLLKAIILEISKPSFAPLIGFVSLENHNTSNDTHRIEQIIGHRNDSLQMMLGKDACPYSFEFLVILCGTTHLNDSNNPSVGFLIENIQSVFYKSHLSSSTNIIGRVQKRNGWFVVVCYTFGIMEAVSIVYIGFTVSSEAHT